MIHIRQGKKPRKKRLPLRDVPFSELVKKAQAGSDAARKELIKRCSKHETRNQKP